MSFETYPNLYYYRLSPTKSGWICTEYAPSNDNNSLPIDKLPHVLVVTGVPKGRSIRSAARRYLVSEGSTNIRVMGSLTDQGCVDWFSYGGSSPVPTINYRTFMTQAKALTIPTGPRTEVSYEVQLPGPGQEFESMKASEISALKCPVLFWEHEKTSTPKVGGLRSQNYFARQAQDGKAVVLLSSRQATASFTKRVPAAIDGRSLAAELASAFIAEMTDDERVMIHDSISGGGDRRAAETIHRVFRTDLSRIDSACALGVHLDRMNQIRDQRASESFADLLTKRSAVSYWIDVPASAPTRPEFVQQHLPLLHALLQNWRSMAGTGQFWDHLFDYINSIRT